MFPIDAGNRILTIRKGDHMRSGKRKKMRKISAEFEDILQSRMKKRQEITELIGATEILIEKAGEQGIDISEPKDLLEKSQTLLKNAQEAQDFDNSKNFAEEANKKITELKNQFDQIKAQIEAAIKMKSDMEKKGIIVHEEQDFIPQIKEVFQKNNYELASKLISKNNEELKGLEQRFDKFETLLSTTNALFSEAKKSNIIITSAEDSFGEIGHLKDNGEYFRAAALMERIIDRANSIKRDHGEASELIVKANSIIMDIKDYELDITEPREMLGSASSAFEQGDYVASISYANKCISSLEKTRDAYITEMQDLADEKITELENELSSVKKMGADTREPGIIFKQVKAALKDNDFKGVFKRIDICRKSIDKALEAYQVSLEKKLDVFISYVEEDVRVALEITLHLEKAGYNCWTYTTDSLPGKSYLIQTKEAVERAKVFLVVISPNSIFSRQVRSEVIRAHESNKEFIPVLHNLSHLEFQDLQPEWREAIGSATSIQIPSSGVEDIISRLVTGIKALNINPTREPIPKRIDRIVKAIEAL